MLNRRKAMVGWMIYSAAKPLAKQALKGQAKKAVPGKGNSRRPSKKAVAAGLGAAAGVVMFWRRRSNGGSEQGPF